MRDHIIKSLQDAIEKAKNWANEGWVVTFGPHQHEVNSLKAAMEVPRRFSHREEALAYWRNVQTISEDVVKHLEGALKDLEKDNLTAAEKKVYAAKYMEKPLEHLTQTSQPIYELIQADLG